MRQEDSHPNSQLKFCSTEMQLSGARRLRDAIILGYQLQRVPGRDMLIPDWYANAESELGLGSGSPTFQMSEENSLMNS